MKRKKIDAGQTRNRRNMTAAAATAPTHTPNIADRAVLVNLSISQWSAAKSDKKVNREVAQNHGSAEDMGNYRKQLVGKQAVKNYTQIATEIRAEFYRLTLPWSDTGERILTSKAYFDFSAKFRKDQMRLEQAWDEFCAIYPQLVTEARTLLNGLFDSQDYPDAHQIRGKFSIKLDVKPVPQAADFRVNLGDDEVNRLRAQITADAQQATRRAMRDVWDRMREVIEKISERCKLYDPDNAKAHPLHDTTVTNISDLLEIIPALNLTGDADVEAFAQQMRDLTKYTPEQLKHTEYAREDTAKRADEILAKMSAFIA